MKTAALPQPIRKEDDENHQKGAGRKPGDSDGSDDGRDGSRFIAFADEPNTLHITLIAAYDETNGGMNFNGYSHGKIVYTVPVGWTVRVTFKNRSGVPHSAVVVEPEMTRRVRVGEPVFQGASTANPVRGTTTTERFSFIAGKRGRYAVACGFPGHAISGHWAVLVVGPEGVSPSLKLGDAETYAPRRPQADG